MSVWTKAISAVVRQIVLTLLEATIAPVILGTLKTTIILETAQVSSV